MATDSNDKAVTLSEAVAQLTSRPNCGHVFDVVRPPPPRRAHMVWSNRMERFVRVELTADEWSAYDKRGSID